MTLCDPCKTAYEKWIDYRFTGPVGRWRTDPPGSQNEDLYWQRSVENLLRAKADRKALVQWQCALIKRLCAEQHSPGVVAE